MLNPVGQQAPATTAKAADPAVATSEEELRRVGFSLGPWSVEPRRHQIVSASSTRRLDPKQLDLLIALVLAPDRLLTRDELLDAVWAETHVHENTLSQAVSRLRRALGDDSTNPRFIETISRSGYRLVAPVRILGAAAEAKPAAISAGRKDQPRTWPSRLGLLATLVLVIAAATRLEVPAPAPSAPRIEIVSPELTLVGTQASPQLSPDGQRIVFSWRGSDEGDWDLWLKTVGEEEPVPFASHPDEEQLPAWSADGERIGYVRVAPERSECGIFVKRLQGGPSARVADCVPGMRAMAWSPDGRVLLHDGFFDPSIASRALFAVEVGSGARRQLTTPPADILGDRNGRFSPDGKLVVFEREISRWRDEVAILTVADGSARNLVRDRWGKVRGVDWAANGDAVLFSSNRNGRFGLWTIPLSGGTPDPVPVHDDWVTQPSMSRDGRRLVYRTFRDRVGLWELRLGPTGLREGDPKPMAPSTRSETQPALSPDGALAFVSDRTGKPELWSSLSAGSDLTRHTNLRGARPGTPDWSPDGRKILYDAAPHGHADLWLAEPNSDRAKRLTDEESDDLNGHFSRDGSSIYFTSDRSGDWEIWNLPVEGGSPRRITSDGGFFAIESPDERFLFVARLDQPGIWRMPVNGGEPEIVIPDLDLSDWGNWAVTDAGLYYVTRRPTAVRLFRFDGSDPVVVFEPEQQIPLLARSLSVSAEGDALVLALIAQNDDEVMRVDWSR